MTQEKTEFDAGKWLGVARALEPVVEAHRDEGETERALPAEIFAAMRDAGLFHLWVPGQYGGSEARLDQVLPVLEEMARQDGAVGWNLAIGVESGLLSGYLPAEATEAIYGADPKAVLATAIQPRGKAIAVDGGYRVSGRWPFASGCQHASWFLMHCGVFDGESPRLTEQGAPVTRFFLVPSRDVRILDTWHTTGLRGTGSNDVEVGEAVVPEGWHFAPTDPSIHPGPLFHTSPFNLLGATLAGVGLGIARAAIDAFGKLAHAKSFAPGQASLAEQQIMQERFAEAEALVRSARSFLFDTAGEISDAMAANQPVSDELRALKDIASANAAKSAATAIELMYDSAGSSSIYASSRLDRCLRDISTLKQHASLATARKAAAGALLLRSYK